MKFAIYSILAIPMIFLISCSSGSSGEEPTTFPDGDDTEQSDFELPELNEEEALEGCEAGKACLQYPAKIDFGAVVFGDVREKEVVLTNIGDEPIEIYSWQLCPGDECPDFELDDSAALAEGSPYVIDINQSAIWQVSYTRNDASDQSVELWIESNHLGGRIAKIELIAREKGEAELQLSPLALSFPDTSVQQKSYVDFRLVNQPANAESTKTIQIVSIEAASPFYLDNEKPGCFGQMEGNERFLASSQTRRCTLLFQPGASGYFEAELKVVTIDGQDRKTHTLDLSGKGVQPFMTLSRASFCGENAFGPIVLGQKEQEVFSIMNSSATDEDLIIFNVELEPPDGAFSIRYFPYDTDSGQDGLNEPQVTIEKDGLFSFELLFSPELEGYYDTQSLVITSNAEGYTGGVATIPICGNAVGYPESVIGLVLGIPALGDDMDDPSEMPALPVANAPVWALDREYLTATDALGRFVLNVPYSEAPEGLRLFVDGTRATNGRFSTKEQIVMLSEDEAAKVVIVLGNYDQSNAQPVVAEDDEGQDVQVGGEASNMDNDMADVLLSFDPAWVSPPTSGEREISIRKASMLELPRLFQSADTGVDPYHVYRFLPLGLSFSGNRAKLQLPNASNISIGNEEVYFYMLSGSPPEWTSVAHMRVVEEPLSQFGSILVTDEAASQGIANFGQEAINDNAYDSIGFIGRPILTTPYRIDGMVKTAGLGQPLLPLHFIASNVFDVGETGADGRFHFNLFGIPGQTVLIGAYRETPLDGSWRSISVSLPTSGFEVADVVLNMPPTYETGGLQGRVLYDDGEPVGLGGKVTAVWVHPDNLGVDPTEPSYNASLDEIMPPAYTTETGSFFFPQLRATPENFLRLFATEPIHHVRSTSRNIDIVADETKTVNLVVSAVDTVAPVVRNAYPTNHAFDVPIDSMIRFTFSEPLDEETLVSLLDSPNRSILLKLVDGEDTPITHFFDENGNWLIIQPTTGGNRSEAGALLEGRTYELSLTRAITDRSAEPNPLAYANDTLPENIAYRLRFKTHAPGLDDGNECTIDSYDWENEEAIHTPMEDGTPCNDDGIECTDDLCTEGVCTHEASHGYCVIDDYCYLAGVQHIDDPCLWCAPEIDAWDWSPRPNDCGGLRCGISPSGCHECACPTAFSCNESTGQCIGIGYVRIHADRFLMGSPEEEPGHNAIETQHLVELTHDFEISPYEVTQGRFEQMMGYNPSVFTTCAGALCPVDSVSWYEAAKFANEFSFWVGIEACYQCDANNPPSFCVLKPDYETIYDCPGYRLPTEAEWEFAARAGSQTAFYNGEITHTGVALDENLDRIAWYAYNSENQPHGVGLKQPNGWGLYDMSGNVWEWTHDWFSIYPEADITIDPVGAEFGTGRVYRGGSWGFSAASCRSASRNHGAPETGYQALGFRLVRTLP